LLWNWRFQRSGRKFCNCLKKTFETQSYMGYSSHSEKMKMVAAICVGEGLSSVVPAIEPATQSG
jgi:hypothetical protein